MITEEQILAAEGYDLEDLAGQVLKPDEYEWDKKGVSHKIPLNWDNAMKWRDWAVKEYGWEKYCDAMAMATFEMDTFGELLHGMAEVIVYTSKPKHYLQAAAICKLNAEKGKQ